MCRDGRRYAADVIIYATGYTFGFPYLQPNDLLPIKAGRVENLKAQSLLQDHVVDLYKHVFPLGAADIAVIGLIQPIGSVAPIAEAREQANDAAAQIVA